MRMQDNFQPKIYKFHRVIPEKNVDEMENVKEEIWKWIAVYEDGTELHQFDDNTGKFHQLKEIDQSKLHIFQMQSRVFEQKYTIIFDPQRHQLIHFYRHDVFNAATPQEVRIQSYIFGYKTLVKRSGDYGGDVALGHYIIITPTGEVVITDNIDNLVITG